jgi:ankyrin repeat protein
LCLLGTATLAAQRGPQTSADGTTPLHLAVQRDDVKGVDALIAKGADVKAANRYGVTPLIVAATNGNAAIIERLLKAGADANTTVGAGETALMTAARTGKVEAVKTLLVHGANVNAKETARGQTALMWAAAEDNAAATKALIESGADLKTRSNGGFTALLFAVRAGKMEAARVLLESGASANDRIETAPAAAMAPQRGGGPAAGGGGGGQGRGGRGNQMPQPQGAPPTPAAAAAAGSETQRTPTGPQGASADPQLAALFRIFDTGLRGTRTQPTGTSALVLAIVNANFELASLLVDRGADVNADAQGWTPLHQLAFTRRPPIQHGLPPAVPKGELDSLSLAKKLLEKGANPNARMTREPNDGARNILNRIGATPFLIAAKVGDIPYMKLLLAHGADASIKTEEGATALMAAAGVGIWHVGESAGTNEEAFEAVKICYELGNDVNAVDLNGDTALHGAAHRGANEVVAFLVEKGAKMDVPNRIGWTPYLIADGVFYPNTYNRHLDTAALLLKLGANPRVGSRRPVDLPPSEEGKP